MNIESILTVAVERGASDVHFKAGRPPLIRIDGELQPLDPWANFDSESLEAVLEEIGASAPRRVAEFHQTGELDTAYQAAGPPALPGERVPPARRDLLCLPRHPPAGAGLRQPRSSRAASSCCRRSTAASSS